jgi:hypothetical protein
MTTMTTSETGFPKPGERGLAAVAAAKDRESMLRRRERNQVFWLWVFGTAAFFAFCVEIGIGMTLNTSLITNQRDELTLIDQVVRGMAALAMAGTFAVSVLLLHVAFSRQSEGGKRILAGLIGTVIFVSAIVLAAAIGYTHFSGLLATLWSGVGALGGISINPAAQGALSTDPPLAIRLMSSVLLVGVALFFAVCELAWLVTRGRLDFTREELARTTSITATHAEFEKTATDFNEALSEQVKLQDHKHQHARAVQAAIRRIQDYERAVEQGRPAPVDPATISKAEFDHQARGTVKADQLIASAQAMAGDSARLMALVDKVFPKPATFRATGSAPGT